MSLFIIQSYVYIDIVKMKIHLIHLTFLTCLFSTLAIQPISDQNWSKRIQRTGAGPIYDAHIIRCTDTAGPGNSWWWKIWCLAQTVQSQEQSRSKENKVFLIVNQIVFQLSVYE